MAIKIKEASYHRNGIGGNGFYAVLFTDSRNRDAGVMVASLFDGAGNCAVYSVNELVKGNVAFACGNSWRGDEFEHQLRPALKKYFEKAA